MCAILIKKKKVRTITIIVNEVNRYRFNEVLKLLPVAYIKPIQLHTV